MPPIIKYMRLIKKKNKADWVAFNSERARLIQYNKSILSI